MNEWNSTPQFEEEVRQSFGVPEIRSEFVDQVYVDLMRRANTRARKSRSFLGLRPAWKVALAILSLMIIGAFVMGPQRVYAAVLQLIGYIPGVGIVDQSVPIRVLAEPVSVTRDGISITVTSAVLTGDRTHIEYRIFGVPGSAYPTREDVVGCTQSEYLRLPDRTRLGHAAGGFQPVPANIDFQPVPANVNEAVLVIPCIFNTLPGTVPENWELPLRFVPAPPNMTVMPVIELSPSPQARSTEAEAMSVSKNSSTATAPLESAVTVQRVIETADGYILVGLTRPQNKTGESSEPAGNFEIRDASGKIVNHTYPEDVSLDVADAGLDGIPWAAQLKAAGLVYPLTISFPMVTVYQPDPSATAEFEFDAGPNPQMGQEYASNQEIQLLGHTLKVVSLTVDSRNGYNFIFQVDPDVSSANVQIEGYTPGGWGGGGKWDGKFNRSLSYAKIPTGKLKVIVSGLTLIGEPVTWQGQWSPAAPRTDLAANPTRQPGLCLTQDTIEQLSPVPATFSRGKALLYEKIDGTENWGLVLYNLDGSGKQVLVPNGNWGALSPNGRQVAYSGTDNAIHIVQVDTQNEQVLLKASGFNIHWSPNGKQLGYIALGNGVVDSVSIASVDGSQARQISDLSYESIIGWSPNGARLYFAAPYTGGAAWKVYAYETSSGTLQEQFTIENGTAKFLNPRLSMDGQWIAYRGRDNSSVYLVHTDGSDMHLLVENAGVVGMAWSLSGWLGISLQKPDSTESQVVLLKPDSCEAYLLPDTLRGELQGLFLP
jgi:hypothetical protein